MPLIFLSFQLYSAFAVTYSWSFAIFLGLIKSIRPPVASCLILQGIFSITASEIPCWDRPNISKCVPFSFVFEEAIVLIRLNIHIY